MSDFVSPLLQWLNANPGWACAATFVISAAESVAIIGTIVPGSITMTAIGTLAGAGIIPLWATLFWAMLGAVVGDSISYWLGYHFKDRLHQLWPFKNNPAILEKGERFVHKYGVMSVFIGRFVGPVRALVPLVAGMFGMPAKKFAIANITSAIGWAPAYMLPGILLGAASLELPPDIALHVILVLFLMTLFIMLCFWSLFKLLQLIDKQTFHMQSWTWQRLQRSKLLSPVTVILKHHQPEKPNGQFNLFLYFLLTSFLFLCLAYYVKQHGAANILTNDVVYHFFRGIRNSTADFIMLNITFIGQRQIILPAAGILVAWLFICRRWRVGLHVLALSVLAAGSVYVIKNIIQSPRPWGLAFSSETFSMPSGHTTLSTTLLIGLALLVTSTFKPGRRWPLCVLAGLIAFAVAVSRLYFGAHWFTDVVSSWLLSASLLIFITISFERSAEKPVNSGSIFLVALLGFLAIFSVYHYRNFTHQTSNYAMLSWPTVEISHEEWWEKDNLLPDYHTSLFGFPSQRINVEWAGDINQIKETLLKHGWSKPPARDWVSTLHRIADVSSTQFLPLISPQYLDRKPAVILTRNSGDGKKLLVIRLWDSSRVMHNGKTTLWAGFVGVVPRPYSWITRKHTGEVAVSQNLVFSNDTSHLPWEWKMITLTEPSKMNQAVQQKIILIKHK